MAALGSERMAVQDALIRYAGEVGWEYVPPVARGKPSILSRRLPGIQTRGSQTVKSTLPPTNLSSFLMNPPKSATSGR
ncbi:hypothetical protein G4V39_10740 [Thermosulfuriphilus ammonigenes]|uniref:Uncharacterized protein n=1 Tax=Thermosulfuriphilus ammonigenes TaxID=1936021 RepID=A0A6G7PZ93_9BACT|nr:hypothetical protein [Thermosulfuriphilus ammonigenes]MBA2849035.1 hypothetical protein [Thermosulfuriphilus ammonigenes]QIJ72723.1 hypothetical protein G4V39_10740 [Thermosulfuriphilus ammonigenes]